MAQLTTADLSELPSSYESPRDIGDVLIGEDTARPLTEACSSGNDTTLRGLLSQPQWIKTMLEKPHVIYSESVLDDMHQVLAKPMSNIERCFTVAAQNGHASVVSTLFTFATDQNVDASTFMTRSLMNKAISGGHAAVIKALASADPKVITFPLFHGALPLYEAIRLRKPDVVAVLLELGADPLHPVSFPKTLDTHGPYLMSHAVFGIPGESRIIEMLIKHGTPVAGTGALHCAARSGKLDIMRLLIQHGADANETISNLYNWTPMHFAASRGQIDAMKLLEEHGARSDFKDEDGKTAAQLLDERKAVEH
ncbi:hypothetical protein HBH98_228740 [Parastagonospora nodorum]|nr:hypothetical protein HBI10_220560 [Parastagonospora nodorum]KAH4009043.1 hypothetical protein HBI13_226610 [Parastagonospora nodorum]KAH4057967.1 hypothetical protein HBH50_234240 [Parastagonospora nodorum]KAH4078490.1 hypothetical protein HBH48_231230 [Parastagonospora nodorum]KAH4336485.1 hypothetical protein HBH98_228740 [Parastagonospora nodorum]